MANYTKEWRRFNRLYGTEVTEHIWCGDEHIADFDGKDATANAKLCVAAPKLYEALKALFKSDVLPIGWKLQVRRVLAEAEGK